MYVVYILECRDGTLYTGITTDIGRRFKQHQSGEGGRYTKSRGTKKLMYVEDARDRSAALKREAIIKKLSRKKKLELIGLSEQVL